MAKEAVELAEAPRAMKARRRKQKATNIVLLSAVPGMYCRNLQAEGWNRKGRSLKGGGNLPKEDGAAPREEAAIQTSASGTQDRQLQGGRRMRVITQC